MFLRCSYFEHGAISMDNFFDFCLYLVEALITHAVVYGAAVLVFGADFALLRDKDEFAFAVWAMICRRVELFSGAVAISYFDAGLENSLAVFAFIH
jgi:hypothetical protein